jgi:hypothetical protein
MGIIELMWNIDVYFVYFCGWICGSTLDPLISDIDARGCNESYAELVGFGERFIYWKCAKLMNIFYYREMVSKGGEYWQHSGLAINIFTWDTSLALGRARFRK